MDERRTRTTVPAVPGPLSAVLLAVALAVGLVLAACAPPAGTQSPTNGTPATEQTPAASVPATAPDEGPTINVPGPADPDDPGPADPLALPVWLPIGPASPNDPSPHGWYERNRNRQCPATDDSFSAVALGLSEVCEAIFEGDASGWGQAARFLAQAPARQPDCLERTAYRVLAGILAFHARHPDVRLGGMSNAAGTACPSEFDGLAQEGGIEVEDRGFGTGEVVRIMGRFDEVRRIAVGGLQVPFEKQAENTYVFEVPEPAGRRSAPVQVWDAAGPVPGAVTLVFADAGTGVEDPDPTAAPTGDEDTATTDATAGTSDPDTSDPDTSDPDTSAPADSTEPAPQNTGIVEPTL